MILTGSTGNRDGERGLKSAGSRQELTAGCLMKEQNFRSSLETS